MKPTRHSHSQFFVTFKIVNIFYRFAKRLRLFESCTPGFFFNRAYYYVIVANISMLQLNKCCSQVMLNLILVTDKGIAIGTIPVGIIEGYKMIRIDMNEKREFALTCFPITIWTLRESQIRIRIKGKIVLRSQFAKLLAFFLCHHIRRLHYLFHFTTKIAFGSIRARAHQPSRPSTPSLTRLSGEYYPAISNRLAILARDAWADPRVYLPGSTDLTCPARQ